MPKKGPEVHVYQGINTPEGREFVSYLIVPQTSQFMPVPFFGSSKKSVTEAALNFLKLEQNEAYREEMLNKYWDVQNNPTAK